MSVGETSPVIVVRAARFPLTALLRLADAAAGDFAGADELGSESEYDAAVERQRRTLAELTLDNPAFMRALAVTNDELARSASARGLGGRRDKRARHLETTLYRYLARGAWRTEPCDLWAGMSLATWGERTCVEVVNARYAVSPDLRPFLCIVQGLSRTAAYEYRGRFRLNHTLRRDGEVWRFEQPSHHGRLRERALPARPGIDALLGALASLDADDLENLGAHLADNERFERENLDDALRGLVRAGILLGGLSFPSTFESAWDALEQLAGDLDSGHAIVWRKAVGDIRQCCARLEESLDRCSIEEVFEMQQRVRRAIEELADGIGISRPQLPRTVVRCDTRLPHRIVLGNEVRRRLEASITALDSFERSHGIDHAVRALHRARRLGLPPSRVPRDVGSVDARTPTQESAWFEAGADALLGRRIQTWAQWLGRAGNEIICSSLSPEPGAVAPLGSLVARHTADDCFYVSLTTEVVPTYGRYGELWRGDDEAAFRRIHHWFTSRLSEAATAGGIDLVELVYPYDPAPNALARPRSGLRRWEPWGDRRMRGLEAARVEMRDAAAAPLLVSDGHRPVAVAFFSPLDVGGADPHVERHLLTSFREVPDFTSERLPFSIELTRANASPRLRISSGDVIRSRRTVISGDLLRDLQRCSRAERFAWWQAEATRRGWPSLVLVGRDAMRPLAVVRDSPIALEAALEGIGEGIQFLTVEEPDERPWLTDKRGDAYIAEIVVPFLRTDHAWSRTVSGLATT